METRPARGRPRTSRLSRTEQLRVAKRAQRERERAAGITAVELRLPATQGARLRAARASPSFAAALDRLLDDLVVDLERWPVLRELAWNRSGRWIPVDEALGLYERNLRFVDPKSLRKDEATFIKHLRSLHAAGILSA